MRGAKLGRSWQLHVMMMPGILLVLVFMYGPMPGIVLAFKDFIPTKGIFGSDWVGLETFAYMMDLPDSMQVFWNTLKIAFLKIVFNFPIPIIVAILINEVRKAVFKRTVQTMIYLPHFLSWVILSGIFIDLFSQTGIVNKALGLFGISPIFFMGEPGHFIKLLIATDVWKNFGYSTIIYLAAITGIDDSLYESARIDGANRFKQIWHITLPGLSPIILLVLTLSLGGILDAGFDQVFNMYNPLVWSSSDIIDTYVYRLAIVEANYSLGTAIGLLKSVVGFVLIVTSYLIAKKYSDYTIF
ncbi:putative aldouronate transport system permease protein [Paenibacillus phyllosphaerae]|uniref:Putative aldouronate transport system permease protein n=1 Tax=Paenibacillus phyllosphaerae TaxID=274593 RepID=A0A7W5AZQ2_9BACL|nr:ABC transporter permease subunit [Paenibacillus phyllosphaerae]MBB3111757.1 putative aldouronate transport system permease protein [Paenibacillus phyllosphaerae]